MFQDSFMEKCLRYEANLFEFDEYVEYWNTHETNMSLREYLGFTEEEYQKWNQNNDKSFIRDIYLDRKREISENDSFPPRRIRRQKGKL